MLMWCKVMKHLNNYLLSYLWCDLGSQILIVGCKITEITNKQIQ